MPDEIIDETEKAIGETEKKKAVIISILAIKAQLPLLKDTDESLNPQALYKEFNERFEKTKLQLLNAHLRVCRERKEKIDLDSLIPGTTQATWNIERCRPGLNRKETQLTGKEASKYSKLLKTADERIEILDSYRKQAVGLTAVGQAEAELERLRSEAKNRKEEVDKVDDKLKNLKAPELSTKIKNSAIKIPEKLVTQSQIDHANKKPVIDQEKSSDPRIKLEGAQYKIIRELEPKFKELNLELANAKSKLANAEKAVSKQFAEKLRLEKIESDLKSKFDKEYNAVKQAIDFVIESGKFFAEDHADFLNQLAEIEQPHRKYETYEDGCDALAKLAIEVKAATDKVQDKVKLHAATVAGELAKVKDPDELPGDPVRQKKVDQARELIAKDLRDPLVAKKVFAAQSSIPSFDEFVKEIADQLEKRPTQTISFDRLKLVYGEPLSTVAGKSTGDGKIEYCDTNKSQLDNATLLDVPGKEIVIAAGPTTNYKPAELKVSVTVDKDQPIISWRQPPPILLDAPLSSKALNAKLLDSFKKVVNEAVTYVPSFGKKFDKAGDEKIEAKYAGTSNRNAAKTVPMNVKVLGTVSELGKEAALSGSALPEPTLYSHKKIMEKWDSDESPKGLKAQSQKVMTDIQDMTPEELIHYMNDFISSKGEGAGGLFVKQGSGDNENQIWYFSNGMQVRYKPKGKVRPPSNERAPMFCVEAKINNDPNQPSQKTQKDDVVFKLTSSGQPGPYGPAQTLLADGVPENSQNIKHKQYMDAACSTTHLKCKEKMEQVITWTNPADLTEGQALGEASLKPTAQDPTALEFTNEKGEVINKDTILPAGAGQILRAKGTETKRYLASVNFVEVKVNVKKVQKVVWSPAKQLVAGAQLGTDVLNATVEDKAVVSYFYFDGTNELPVDVAFVPPAGQDLEFRAKVASTDLYHAVTDPVVVKIEVKKQPQEVTWNPLKTDLKEGEALGADVLNASSSSGVQPEYFQGSEPLTEASILPLGGHELQAIAKETDVYNVSPAKKIKISVKPKEESI